MKNLVYATGYQQRTRCRFAIQLYPAHSGDMGLTLIREFLKW
jgi:hypothetical protein